MKALKEKRIRLRSLWRRGLVILSLFALVFASCSDSSGNEEDNKPTDPVATRLVVTGSLGTQYEGTKVTTTGLKVKAYFGDDDLDGKELTAADGYTLTVKPDYAQGFLGEARTTGGNDDIVWIPVDTYTVTAAYQSQVWIADFHPLVVPIVRNTSINGNTSMTLVTGPAWYPELHNMDGNTSLYWYYYDGGGKGPWTTALNEARIGNLSASLDSLVIGSAVALVGPTDDTAYVDDIYALSTSFRLQATYVDGQVKDLPLTLADTLVRVHYSNGKDKTGTGDVVVNVKPPAGYWLGGGDNWKPGPGGTSVYDLDFNEKNLPWFTKVWPLKEVYHVTGIAATGIPADYTSGDGLNQLASINYWADEGDNTAAGKAKATALWIAALDAAKVKLDVTYTNGEHKDLTMPQAFTRGMVWYNENPLGNTGNPLATPPADLAEQIYNTFAIQNVRVSTTPENKLGSNPAGYAYNKLDGVDPGREDNNIIGPQVKVNYRGAETYIPVDVWVSVDNFSVDFKDAADAERGYTVADIKDTDNDLPAKQAALSVVASIDLSSARGNVMTVAKDANGNERLSLAPFNAGTWEDGMPGSWNRYTNNFQIESTNAANNNKTKAVTFYYAAPPYPETSGITKTAKKYKQSLRVEWHGIK